MTSICPPCDFEVESNSKAVQCRICHKWLHYFCTGLPTYYIVLLAGSAISFTCETCIIDKFKEDFVSRHAEVVEAVNAHKQLRTPSHTTGADDETINLPTDNPPSPATTVATVNTGDGTGTIIPTGNSGATNDPISNKQMAQNAKTVGKEKSVCQFHLQGRCIHGRFGNKCKKSHPALCRKYILKGEPGCSLGSDCRYTHPRLCVKSLQNNSCPRVNCFLYHVTGSSRPNLPKNKEDTPTTEQESSDGHVPAAVRNPPNTTPPTNQANYPPQLQSSHATLNTSFLDQLNELRSQIQSILMMQRQLMQYVFPQMQMWPTPPPMERRNGPQFAQKPNMPFQYAPSHPQW